MSSSEQTEIRLSQQGSLHSHYPAHLAIARFVVFRLAQLL
jgi:hypothetical protein